MRDALARQRLQLCVNTIPTSWRFATRSDISLSCLRVTLSLSRNTSAKMSLDTIDVLP